MDISPILDNLHLGLWLMSGIAVVGLLIALYFFDYIHSESRLSFQSGATKKVLYDKRRARRVASDLWVKLRGTTGSAAPVSRLINFSPTGACMASELKLNKGTRIEGRLVNGQTDQLQITGHIVWAKRKSQGSLYGILFESVQSIT